MNTAKAKKPEVPDISNLLGQISEKRSQIPRPPLQRVEPVEEADLRENVKTLKRQNTKAVKTLEPKGAGGRPTAKKPGIDYVKISPRVEKGIIQRAKIALTEERFRVMDDSGESQLVKTMDELVALALHRLLEVKK